MVNNDHMLNKNVRNGKKWKSIILQRASMIIPAPNHYMYITTINSVERKNARCSIVHEFRELMATDHYL